MAESVKYQRFVLRFVSPWNLGTDTVHSWAVKFSCTGATNCPQADQEATALDLAAPILGFIRPLSYLEGWDHYPIGSATHDFGASYPKDTHPGTENNWTGSNNQQQCEVCVLATAHVGESSKGRPVYLRKWIHDVCATVPDPNQIGTNKGDTTIYAKWNHGCGPHNLVPVSPSTGQQPLGDWASEPHLFTHQLRRGPKVKRTAAASLIPGVTDAETVLKLYEKLAGIGG